MLKTTPNKIRLAAVPMTVETLMNRPIADVVNYESEVLPLIRLFANYKHALIEGLIQMPGTFYGVINFNLKDIEPDWCRKKLNLFDMKLSRSLVGRNWSSKPDSTRPHWIAVPERAKFLHYNSVWDVPIEHHLKFFLEAPTIWRGIVPSGQFHLQVIGEQLGEEHAPRIYSGRTFHPRWTIDGLVTSSELRRRK
jgi:hypothetical protein